MSNEIELTEDGRVPALQTNNKGEVELITKKHPWMGHPNFIFLRNVEDSVRNFYDRQEVALCWSAIRALLLDDEEDFKRVKKKYRQLEDTIKSELQWAKENPEVIENPGKVLYQGTDTPNPGSKDKRKSPFMTAITDQMVISAIDGYSKIKPKMEVEVPIETRYSAAALSGLNLKTKCNDIQKLYQLQAQKKAKELQEASSNKDQKQIT